MNEEAKRAAREVSLAAVSGAAFYLFAAALFAVVVRAYAPPQGVIAAVNWILKSVGAFCFCLLFVHRGRALFKGMGAGAAMCVLAMFLFAAIGGGFRLTWLFPAELALSAVLGGAGAALGVKLRKEE